ncbi:unnamed protein product [Candida verbasci]|uniref:BAR domain-containing protein n=1 Tax=Candida verbasci TaxID=1227364 RepID=A0A9W4TVC8_9ASCO|nr:unnamed protein product [Candida verbasci]
MSEPNKITNIVSNKLKSLDISNTHVDWHKLKRAPQILKQKIKSKEGSLTVDEEFDELENKFVGYNRNTKNLIQHFQTMNESIDQLIVVSISISECFQNAIDPYSHMNENNTIKNEKEEEEAFELWSKVTRYKNIMKSIIDKIERVKLTQLKSIEKLGEIIKINKLVYKTLDIRHGYLLEYDSIYNEYNNLLMKKEQGENLTIKQSNQFYNLQRKLEDYRDRYKSINFKIKSMLPLYMTLIQDIITIIVIKLFFANLQYFQCVVELLENVNTIDG